MNMKCPKCNTENPLYAKYCRHCGHKFDNIPEIIDFRTNTVCRVGDVIDFSWKASNVDKITLNGQVVTGKSHLPITINKETVFTLVATKGKNKVYRTIVIKPQPIIEKPISQKLFSNILRHIRLSILFAIIAIMVLVISEKLRYYMNFSYSDWLIIGTIIKIVCWGVLGGSIAYIFYSIVKFINKKRS